MNLNDSTDGRWLTGNSAFRVLPSAYWDSGRCPACGTDPLGGNLTNPQSLNRYAYALNSPTTLTDPSGLQADDCDFDSLDCGQGDGGDEGCIALLAACPSGCDIYTGIGCWPFPPPPPIPPPIPPIPPPTGGGNPTSPPGPTTLPPAAGNPNGPEIPGASLYTASINAGVSVQLGWFSFSLALALAIDTKGCVAITRTVGAGVGGWRRHRF